MIQQTKEEKTIEELIPLFKDVDILILEGFKYNKFPKVEVHRKGIGEGILYNSPSMDTSTYIAIASDEELDVDVKVLDLNDVYEIADYIEMVLHKMNHDH